MAAVIFLSYLYLALEYQQYMNIIIPAEMCNLYALWLSLVIPTAIIQAAYEYTYLVHNFGAPHAVARVIVCVLLVYVLTP